MNGLEHKKVFQGRFIDYVMMFFYDDVTEEYVRENMKPSDYGFKDTLGWDTVVKLVID